MLGCAAGKNGEVCIKPAKVSPSVFVLILNWNGWQDTVQCIESLKSLTYPNYEIVVLDNASTNDSVARIREAHPDVILIETGANLGFAGGNNVGIRYALDEGADYIWLLNNDTKVFENTLEAFVAAGEENQDIGILGSPIYEMNEPEVLQTWGGGRINMWLGRATRCKQGETPDYITGASMFVRRTVFNTIGLLDDKFFMYWEDADFSLRAAKHGWKLYVEPRARVLHKESASVGLKSYHQFRMYTESSLYFFDKHSSYSLLSKSSSILFRLTKRLTRFDSSGLRAIYDGVRDYHKKYRSRTKDLMGGES